MHRRQYIKPWLVSCVSYIYVVKRNCAPHSNVCTGPYLSDYDCFAAFNTRRIILSSSGIDWSVVELQAPLLPAYACSMHTKLYQRMTAMRVWGRSPPVRSFMQI